MLSAARSLLTDRPFERAMWLWGRDALVLAQLPPVVEDTRPPRFLDVGCGSGLLAISAAELGFEVTALDLAEREVARLDAKIAAAPRGSRTATAITTQVGDGQTLEQIADASIDVVGSVFGMFMFPDRETTWTSALRVLTPRGRLFATSWDGATANANLFRYVLANAADREAPPPPPAEPPKPNGTAHADSFRAELEACGFVDVHIHTVGHPIAFKSGEEMLLDLFDSPWVRSVVGHKHEASVKRAALDFAQLVLDGEDPCGDLAASRIRVAADVRAEDHPLWSQPFVLPGLGHIAVATKP